MSGAWLPRWEREGWRPIEEAPYNNSEHRLGFFQGERLLWEHVGRRAIGTSWRYDRGYCTPTHWKPPA